MFNECGLKFFIVILNRILKILIKILSILIFILYFKKCFKMLVYLILDCVMWLVD